MYSVHYHDKTRIRVAWFSAYQDAVAFAAECRSKGLKWARVLSPDKGGSGG